MYRTTRWSVVVLLAGFAVCLGGCENRANSTKPLVLKPVPFTILNYEEGQSWRLFTPAHYVIRDAGQWERLWRRAHSLQSLLDTPPTPPLPPADLTKQVIIAVFQGRCPSSGYGITIIEVSETDEQLTVVVEYREPGPGERVLAVMTDPYCMVSIPHSDKPVGFRIVEAGDY